jgi:hypothetical protein
MSIFERPGKLFNRVARDHQDRRSFLGRLGACLAVPFAAMTAAKEVEAASTRAGGLTSDQRFLLTTAGYLGMEDAKDRLFLSGRYRPIYDAIKGGGYRVVPEGEPVPMIGGTAVISGDLHEVAVLPPRHDVHLLVGDRQATVIPLEQGYRIVFIRLDAIGGGR